MSKNSIASPTDMGFPFDCKQLAEFQVNIFSNDRDIRKCRRLRRRQRRQQQGYDNTSTFSSKTDELKKKLNLHLILV